MILPIVALACGISACACACARCQARLTLAAGAAAALVVLGHSAGLYDLGWVARRAAAAALSAS